MKHIPRRFRKHYYRDRAEGKRMARAVADVYARYEREAARIFAVPTPPTGR